MDTVVKQALFNYRATKAWDRVHTSQRTNSWCFCGDWTQRSWPQAARYQEKRIMSGPHIRKKQTTIERKNETCSKTEKERLQSHNQDGWQSWPPQSRQQAHRAGSWSHLCKPPCKLSVQRAPVHNAPGSSHN